MLKIKTINTWGFTLLEVMAVVAIIVLVSTITYANYHNMNKQGDVIGMNERMVNDLRKTQNNTIQHKQWDQQVPIGWGVKIDNTNDKYTVFADFDGDKKLSNAIKLLIHGTEYSSGPTFVESSNIGRTMTLANSPIQATGNGRPVGTAGYWSFNGSTQYLTAPDSDDFYFGTGNFTIDFYMYLTALNNAPYIMGQYEDANNYWYIQVSDSITNRIIFKSVDGGVTQANYTMYFALASEQNKWIHIALVRDGKNLYIYKGGKKQIFTGVTKITAGTDLANHAGVLELGVQNAVGGFLAGYLDEVRIIKGAAMWKASRFDLPTKQYIGGVETVKEEILAENVAIGTITGDLGLVATLDLFFSPSDYSTYQATSGNSVLSAGNVSITLTNADGTTAKTITINPYGLISSN